MDRINGGIHEEIKLDGPVVASPIFGGGHIFMEIDDGGRSKKGKRST